MNNSLILPTNRVNVLLSRIKLSSYHMLGMPHICLRSRSLPARIPKQIHLSIISCSDQQTHILRTLCSIDMCSIYSTWIYTICIPAKLAWLGCPLFIFVCSSSSGHLSTIRGPIKKLISTTDCSQRLRILTPVEAMNIGAMSLANCNFFIPIVDLIDIDFIIMGSHCQQFSIGGVFHYFVPLFGMIECFYDIVNIIIISYTDVALVIRYSNMIIIGVYMAFFEFFSNSILVLTASLLYHLF